MLKLYKNDEVKIIRGKDKGKTGKIERVFPLEQKVLVHGMNEFKRHVKGSMGGQKSEIITIAKPLSMANVRLLCPKCHEMTRVGFTIDKNKKVRECKKCRGTF